MKRITGITDLTLDPKNANRGTERGRGLLEQSLQRCGAGRSIVVDRHGVIIAGNKTFEEAAQLGFDVQVVKADGHKLIVVQREDLDLASETDARARELALADNRVAELDLDWSADVLLHHMDGVDVGRYFTDQELARIAGDELRAEEPEDTNAVGGKSEAACPACGHRFTP